MPDWVTEYLKQSPTLAVCLGVVYFAWKYHQALNTRFLASLEAAHASHLASKDAEIKRLIGELELSRKERDKLLKQITSAKEKS